MLKKAISVTTNAEPETQFVAGMPTSPAASLARTEVLAVPRRVPKTMAFKTEGGIATAIAEGASQQVDNLSRKFGSAFIRGMLSELQKGAHYGLTVGSAGKTVAQHAPRLAGKTALEPGIRRLGVRAMSMLPSRLTAPQI